MFMMATPTDQGRQHPQRIDAHMARVIDIGIGYQATLGYPGAKAYLRENGIPQEIIDRVLSSPSARRSDSWGLQP